MMASRGYPCKLSETPSTTSEASPSRKSGEAENLHHNLGATLQQNNGAPIEHSSPLGYEVSFLSALFLNVGNMIGTGIFTIPGTILNSLGSVGLSLIFWAFAVPIATADLSVYLELASYFPNRSGGTAVYLEQAYPRPFYLVPFVFAIQQMLLSYTTGNAIVLAQYIFEAAGHDPSEWEEKGLAVGCVTAITIMLLLSTKQSLRVANVITVTKLLTLLLIGIIGIVVLSGVTRVRNPTANFKHSFRGSTTSVYDMAVALIKINYSFSGYRTAINFANELRNPVPTLKKICPLSLIIVAITFMLCNVAYFAAVSKEDIKSSELRVASLLFIAVFGEHWSLRLLNVLIALNALGSIISTTSSFSRILRECGRQGVLPYPRLWASVRPFGTPLVPYLAIWLLTVLTTLAPPAGDAFNFVIDLQSYPGAIFCLAVTCGLFLIRHQRQKRAAEKPKFNFRAWNIAVAFSLVVNIFLVVMPWVQPKAGPFGGDVSFWYATYCAVALGILGFSFLYWFGCIRILPKLCGYRIRTEIVELQGKALAHRFVKIQVGEIAEWDAKNGAEKANDSNGSGAGENCSVFNSQVGLATT